jgi:phosphatidylserine decarboxylase
MIKRTDNAQAEQARRLRIKTQEQQLARLAVDGAGLSPWEAEELVEAVKEVFFTEPQDNPLRSGQMFYECAASSEGAGKPLDECKLIRAVLTLHEPGDIQIAGRTGAEGLRRHCILRLTEEAREQGGLLTQEDLARLLHCDVRTIRRDVADFRERGVMVATRGQQKDIGPGVTHRGVAIAHWIDGNEPVEVARRINHSLAAVERYLQTFARVVFLQQKQFDCFGTALTMGVSVASVKTYLAVYDQHRKRAEFTRRLQEIEIIGGKFYETQDFQKGGPSHGANAKNEWRMQ